VKIKYLLPQRIHYLTVLGHYLTPNTTIVSSGANTGPLTANTVCDFVQTPNHKELAVNLTIQAVSGTFSTGQGLTAYFDMLDPVEPQNVNVNSSERPPVLELKLNSTAITTAPTTIRFIIANGVATVWINNASTALGNVNVPYIWQVRFAITGSSPSFSIVGTYEARE
jgi:hypothetical protein